jgi:hypothetical protein
LFCDAAGTKKNAQVEALNTEGGNGNTALALLASAYGNSSDSEEDAVDDHESNAINSTSESLPSNVQVSHDNPMTRPDKDDILSESTSYEAHRFEGNFSQPCDQSLEDQDYKITSGVAFENTRRMSYSTTYSSQDANNAEKSLSVEAMDAVNHKNALLVPQCDEDSSRMHVFCLEHAVEAEQQLRPIGGAHILLLCHPGLGLIYYAFIYAVLFIPYPSCCKRTIFLCFLLLLFLLVKALNSFK